MKTKEELTQEALQEMQESRERNFKADIKNGIRAIMSKQRDIEVFQEEIKELQRDLKKLKVVSFDESSLV